MIATVFSPKVLRAALPALSLLILLGAIWYLNPRAISPLGFNLMFNLAVPIALATVAQMCVITINELDLSIGAYVGFVVCVAATRGAPHGREHAEEQRAERRRDAVCVSHGAAAAA